jgi:hypothetical protein
MTLLPLKQACSRLGIDAKTSRHWMQQANLLLSPHPSDARIKCVTSQQLEHLAALHHRPLDEPAAVWHSPLPEKLSPQAEPDVLSKLTHLETQVALLQQQMTGLVLELLQERTVRDAQRLHALEARIHSPSQHDRATPARSTAHEQGSQPDMPPTPPRVHPMKGRPRPILPLIEYTADGSYIVICPQQGELVLIPDSPAWFAWLETVSSLRFLGQQGRWSAYRDKRRSAHGWFAYRRMHGHQYVHALGSPHELTMARFEQMAATLQAYVTTF